MLNTPLIVDIETDGRPAQTGRLLLVGYQLATDPTAGVGDPSDTIWYADGWPLGELLADPLRPKVTMTKYDSRYLQLQGWDVQGPVYDLQVMAWVMNENQMLALDPLAKRYAGITMDKRIKRRNGTPWFTCDCGKTFDMADLDPGMDGAECHWSAFVEYCRRDVEAETKVFNTLWSRLEDTAWLDYFLDEEVPFTSVLLGMETAGLPVNLDDSETLRARLEVEAAADREGLLLDASLPAGFNIGSGDMMAKYLYSKVFELTATLDLGPDAILCLKSCLDGEHEDCYLAGSDCPPVGEDVAGRHIVDLLPDRFTIDSVGRTSVHGRYTLKGRGLTPTTMTPSGARWSTASPVLKSNLVAMQDEWVVKLLDFRKVEKVLTTYLRRFPELAQVTPCRGCEEAPVGQHAPHAPNARLYGRFNQTGTKTGRLSSSEPNLQNIPARGPLGEAIRGLFQGDLVVGDYSQLEPRLLAHFSQDPVLLDIYRSGQDIYDVTGTAVFGKQVEKGMPERDIAKVVFLGDQYGMGKEKLAATLTMNGFPTMPDVAKGYQRELHSLYRVAELWKEAVRADVKRKGYVVTIGGRHRRLKAAFEDRRNWKNVGYGERQAVNAIIQGSAGDVVRRAMVVIVRDLSEWFRLLAQVHDELVFEHFARTVMERLALDDGRHSPFNQLRDAAEMGHGYSLTVPLVFEPHFGTSWFSAKEGIELPEDLVEETAGFEEE
jgi:DNA polymerase I-like protein with 3'-5' exonuclease and polymerase domains